MITFTRIQSSKTFKIIAYKLNDLKVTQEHYYNRFKSCQDKGMSYSNSVTEIGNYIHTSQFN